MTVYGYARVSTVDQNLDRQKDALRAYGVDRLFCEKVSGAKKSRPELDKMLAVLESGDSVVIESLSRLGRSVKNLSELMEMFNEYGATYSIASVKFMKLIVKRLQYEIYLAEMENIRKEVTDGKLTPKTAVKKKAAVRKKYRG